MKRLFCQNCLKETDCKYEEELVSETIDGTEIEYLEKNYRCTECNCIAFDEETFNYNIKEGNNKLREKTGIITTYEIEEILDKYSIGKKPLASVLNLGEVNILRYLDGKNPTREISDKLKEINENPFVFETYLISNQDKISSIAFKKSLGKVKQLELTYEHSKLYNSALYILNKVGDITNLALQKLLYFCDGFNECINNSKITNAIPEAWRLGPVYRDLYDSFSYFERNMIDRKEILNDEINLTEEEKAVIDAVVLNFGCYSPSILVDMSHSTTPWIKAREGLEPNENSNRIIEEKDMKEYFKNICKEYDIKTPEDISKYSVDLFNRVFENRKNSN